MERMNERIAKIASQRAAQRATRGTPPPAGADSPPPTTPPSRAGERKPPVAHPRPDAPPASGGAAHPRSTPPASAPVTSPPPIPAAPSSAAPASAAPRDAAPSAPTAHDSSGRRPTEHPLASSSEHPTARPAERRAPDPRAEELNAAPILELPRRPRPPRAATPGTDRSAALPPPMPLVRPPMAADDDGSLVSLRDALREFRARLEAERAARAESARRGGARQGSACAAETERAAAAPNACPICGGAGYLRQDLPADDPFFGQPVPCVCKEHELEEKRRRQLDRFFSLQPFAEKTFETFNPAVPGTREAFDVARAYAEEPMGWLVLSGGYGCGKTHLAAAIAHHRLAAGSPIFFAVVPDLLDHLRAAFAPTSEMPYDTMFDTIREVQLLVLDDLGAENSTAWATEKLFQLINYRYNFRMPTVFTTNNQLQSRMDERIRSRLGDLSFVRYLVLKTGDFRPRSARRRG